MLDGLRVLVVEDEVLIAADLAEIVGDAGARVVGPCFSVKEARQLIRDERIDAALLDVNLADGDLTPLLEALRARAVPVLVYTGGELPQRVRERHPDLTVLRKPLQPGRLLLELKRVTRQADTHAVRQPHAG
ncbi:MAG TPA: response regulator [Microvirga sp.]|jgi:DNA-binding response OmpR family regulator|nr:response regulator [Microvirga sp.]